MEINETLNEAVLRTEKHRKVLTHDVVTEKHRKIMIHDFVTAFLLTTDHAGRKVPQSYDSEKSRKTKENVDFDQLWPSIVEAPSIYR